MIIRWLDGKLGLILLLSAISFVVYSAFRVGFWNGVVTLSVFLIFILFVEGVIFWDKITDRAKRP